MEAIRQLQAVQGRLEAQLRAIQSELDAVKKAISVLQRDLQQREQEVVEIRPKELSGMRITEAIRRLIQNDFTTPLTVRDQLMRGGFPHKDKGKLLNVVWATMQRLSNTAEYEAGKADGKFALRRRAASGNSPTLPLAESAKAVQ